MLFRGGRREALFALPPLELDVEFEPAEFDVLGVVEEWSFEPVGEGVSSIIEKLSFDSSKMAESLMFALSAMFIFNKIFVVDACVCVWKRM